MCVQADYVQLAELLTVLVHLNCNVRWSREYRTLITTPRPLPPDVLARLRSVAEVCDVLRGLGRPDLAKRLAYFASAAGRYMTIAGDAIETCAVPLGRDPQVFKEQLVAEFCGESSTIRDEFIEGMSRWLSETTQG